MRGKRFAVVLMTASAPAMAAAADAASAVGYVLGMLAFGYVVMKLFNRDKGDDDGERSGRPWLLYILVFLVVGVLLMLFRR